jgi:hypothetical protein
MLSQEKKKTGEREKICGTSEVFGKKTRHETRTKESDRVGEADSAYTTVSSLQW